LFISPKLNESSFFGSVSINLIFEAKTDTIILNGKNIELLKITFDNVNINLVNSTYNEEYEQFIIKLDKEYNEGDYILDINYSALINDSLNGLYRSYYNKTHFLMTHFEPTDARKVLPCFDEPYFKANFIVNIECEPHLCCISNMPISNTTFKDSLSIYTFEKTPKMSTYLLVFAIGEFEYLEGKTNSNLPIRIYCTPGNKEKLHFGLEVTIKGIEWFENFFDIPYQLPKLDSLASPDFCCGAMENWGLITYRELYFFCTDKTTVTEKQDIVEVICHELSHQWFGNLVTMEWWNNLWLNESMANYFGNYVGSVLYPELNIWDNFMTNTYNGAFNLDSLESSHPIEVEIEKAQDINEIFDAISYNKGSCLINYMIDIIGMDSFRFGMKNYLTKYSYQNTVSEDFWNTFDNKELANHLLKLVKMIGYPVVSVIKDDNANVLELKQNRFLKNGDICESTYPLIIKMRNNNEVTNVELTNTNIKIPYKSTPIINPNGIGYYRVNYMTNINYNLITNSLEKTKIIDDMFQLSLCGYKNIISYIEFINKLDLSNEISYIVWNQLIKNYKTLENIIIQSKDELLYNSYKQFMYNKFAPISQICQTLTYEPILNEPANNSQLRLVIIDMYSQMNNEYANNLKSLYYTNPNVSGKWYGIKEIILSLIGKTNTDELLKLYNNVSTNAVLVTNILEALGESENENDIDKIIAFLFSGNVRTQDVSTLYFSLATNRYAYLKLWNYVKNNWSVIVEYFPDSLSYAVKYIAELFSTKELYDEYCVFMDEVKPIGCDMSIKQTIEKIKIRIKLCDRIISELKNMNYEKLNK
jgi:aminopeptidase N